jgi:hypothetical protein
MFLFYSFEITKRKFCIIFFYVKYVLSTISFALGLSENKLVLPYINVWKTIINWCGLVYRHNQPPFFPVLHVLQREHTCNST